MGRSPARFVFRKKNSRGVSVGPGEALRGAVRGIGPLVRRPVPAGPPGAHLAGRLGGGGGARGGEFPAHAAEAQRLRAGGKAEHVGDPKQRSNPWPFLVLARKKRRAIPGLPGGFPHLPGKPSIPPLKGHLSDVPYGF